MVRNDCGSNRDILLHEARLAPEISEVGITQTSIDISLKGRLRINLVSYRNYRQ